MSESSNSSNLLMESITTWEGKSFGDSAGDRRFAEFKNEYNGVIFKRGNLEAKADDFKTWGDVQRFLGFREGSKNPHTANITTIIDDSIVDFNSLKRLGQRKSGVNAADMEDLVGITILMDISSWDEFLEKYEDDKFMSDLSKRFPNAKIDKIMNLVQDNKSYSDNFIRVGLNARGLIKNPSKYKILDRKKWNDIKSYAADLISKGIQGGEEVKADKWNPADILIYAGSESVITDLLNEDDIYNLNETFNSLMMSNTIYPISVKENPSAIRGSRGITEEVKRSKEVSILKILRDGFTHPELKNTNIWINYNPDKFPESLRIHKRVLGWINEKGKTHIENTASIALGYSSWTSNYYIVNNEKSILVDDGYKKSRSKKLKLTAVCVSFTSQAIWLYFGDELAIVRTKGARNIHMTIDGSRSDTYIIRNKLLDALAEKTKLLESSSSLKEIDNSQKLIEHKIFEDYMSIIPSFNFINVEEPKYFGDLELINDRYQ